MKNPIFMGVGFTKIPTLKIIQRTILKHYPLCGCRETSTVEYISLQTVTLI